MAEKSAEVAVTLQYDGVPRGYFISQFGDQLAVHRWDWPSGIHWETKEWLYPPRPDWASRFEALGLRDSGNEDKLRQHWNPKRREAEQTFPDRSVFNVQTQYLRIEPGYIPGMLRDRPAYRFEAHLALQRYELAWEHSLKTGPVWKSEASVDRVISLQSHLWKSNFPPHVGPDAGPPVAQWSRETLVVVMVNRRPSFSVAMASSGIWKLLSGNFGAPVDYLLIDPARTVISHTPEGAASWPVHVAGMEFILKEIGFDAPLDFSKPNRASVQPGWSNDVKLAKVVTRNVETFTAETIANHFELQPMKEKGRAP